MNLADKIRQSEELIHWLDNKISGLDLNSGDRILIAAGCLDMVREHQKSIVLLSSRQLYGSAAALVRLVSESYLRGIWLLYCATEADLEKFKNDKFDKKVYQLIQDIENLKAFDVGVLSRVKEKAWSAMNSYTHTGFLQVVRRIRPGEIGPDYPEEEIIEALGAAGSYALLAAIAIADMAGDDTLALSVLEKSKQFLGIS